MLLPTLFATIGDDILVGDDEGNILYGESGGDVLVGVKGRDTLVGGEGNDTLLGGGLHSSFWGVVSDLSEEDPTGIFYFNRPDPLTFAETLRGQAGDDVLIGGSWHDANADQKVGAEELTLGSLDQQESWGFNNVMWGGVGNDELHGANGFDTLGGGAGDDLIYGYGGIDRIFGGAGNDTIVGGAGDPELFHREEGGGSIYVEELYGGAGNDEISGGEGDDYIFGGTGSDFLSGGAGDDTLLGGAGSDVFEFIQGFDTLSDFNPDEDTLSLEFGLSREQYKAQSQDTVIGGEAGLLLTIGDDDSVFLVGLKLENFDELNIAI